MNEGSDFLILGELLRYKVSKLVIHQNVAEGPGRLRVWDCQESYLLRELWGFWDDEPEGVGNELKLTMPMMEVIEFRGEEEYDRCPLQVLHIAELQLKKVYQGNRDS